MSKQTQWAYNGKRLVCISEMKEKDIGLNCGLYHIITGERVQYRAHNSKHKTPYFCVSNPNTNNSEAVLPEWRKNGSESAAHHFVKQFIKDHSKPVGEVETEYTINVGWKSIRPDVYFKDAKIAYEVVISSDVSDAKRMIYEFLGIQLVIVSFTGKSHDELIEQLAFMSFDDVKRLIVDAAQKQVPYSESKQNDIDVLTNKNTYLSAKNKEMYFQLKELDLLREYKKETSELVAGRNKALSDALDEVIRLQEELSGIAEKHSKDIASVKNELFFAELDKSDLQKENNELKEKLSFFTSK